MTIKDLPFVGKLKRASFRRTGHSVVLGTETYTEVKREQTDKDPQRVYELEALGTETFTKTQSEPTDRDPYDWS